MNCLPVIFYVIQSEAKRVGSITWIFRLHNETCAASPGGKRYNSEMTVAKCKGNRDKALYFVRQTMNNNWSRAVLMNFLDTNLYERDGKAITNSEKMLSGVGTDSANEITKDSYNFDFLTMRAGYDEKELKDALMNNIQSFCWN